MNQKTKTISFILIVLCTLLTAQAFADTISYVSTPNGTSVQVIIRTEMTAAQISSLNTYYQNAYPNATYLRTSTNKYNCHSYAWYSQSTSNTAWMNDPSAYWADDSYYFVSSLAVSDKILYADINNNLEHSAIYQGGVTMVSKWGAAPLFRHAYNYCPYSTANLYGLRR